MIDIPANRLSNENRSDKLHVGLEIGTTKIRVVVAEGKGDRTIRILGVGEAPSRGVREGEIVDPVAAAECICAALREAEESSKTTIKKVSVAITGSHLKSFISRASLIFPKAPHQISLGDITTVEQMAWDAVLPGDNILIQAIQGDYVCEFLNTNIDYQEHAVSAEDFGETCLKADFHIIHGSRKRIQRTLDCLESLQLEVESLVPSSLACATALLTREEMLRGVLVIDLGGGITDYLIYLDGAVRHSGVLAVGGDHITNDISIGLRLPIAIAELVKTKEGSVSKEVNSHEGIITLKRDPGLPDYEIDRVSLDTIIHLRVREIFQQVRNHIASSGESDPEESILEKLNEVVLTGGGSKLHGIAEVASQVFKLPVKLGHASGVSGTNSIIENPGFTTAIGLTKYAIESTPSTFEPQGLSTTPIEESLLKKEIQNNKEYRAALREERGAGKNLSQAGGEDLDIPTFLRKGTDGVEIKPAK